MRRIYKYAIHQHPNGPRAVMPSGSKILSVGGQGSNLVIWAEVDPGAPEVARRFAVVPTGGDVPRGPFSYLGTVQTGPFVWHIYELAEA